jgi:hypothetical protein
LPSRISFAGAQLIVETSGGFAISFDSTLDGTGLTDADTISLDITQKGSDIQNEYNATWAKDTIPASFATYDTSRSGAIAFYVAMEDADDFYQPYQQINVVDDDFIGQGGAIPSTATYVYTPNDSNRWLRIATSAPVIISEGLDKVVAKNFRDFGMVLGQQATPPVSPADGDAYIVLATATGDWAGQEQQIATYSSTLAAWAFSNVHKDWDEVRDDSDSQLYRFNSSGPTWDIVTASIALPVDDTTEIVRDPADNTKTMRIDVGALATATTRVLTMPNQDIDLASIPLNDAHRVTTSGNPHSVTASDVGNTTAQWNANQLLGKVIDSAAATPSNGDILSYNGSSGEWENGPAGGGGTSGRPAFECNFDTDVTASEPASGAVKFDNATPGSATTIRCSTTDINTVNITNQLSSVGSGDAFIVYQINDTTKFLYFLVTSSTLVTTSYDIVGTSISGGVAIDNGAACGVAAYVLTTGGASGVASFNGRTGGVIPAIGDYTGAQVTDTSGVGGTYVSDSLDILNNTISPTGVASGTDNDQTGTTYTLVLTDQENKTVWMNNALPNTVTIPTNASVAFDVGNKIAIMMEGVGVTTVQGDTGVTLNGTSGGSIVINNQYQGVTLTKRAADTWIATGDLT